MIYCPECLRPHPGIKRNQIGADSTTKCDWCYVAREIERSEKTMQEVLSKLCYPHGRETFMQEFDKRFITLKS